MPDAARTLERLVRDALPGDDDASRAKRLAIVRIVHAAENADRRLTNLGASIRRYLDGPDDSDSSAYAWRMWRESEAVASNLENLARELRKSHRKLVELAGLNPDERNVV